MRVIGTFVLAAVVSSVVASALIFAAVYLQLGISLGPHMQFELIALIAFQTIMAIGTAVVLAIVLAAGGEKIAVRRAALLLALVLVLSLGALEVFGLSTGSSAEFSSANAFAEDLPFLGVIAIPGLVTILIQWWSVRRHLVKTTTIAG